MKTLILSFCIILFSINPLFSQENKSKTNTCRIKKATESNGSSATYIYNDDHQLIKMTLEPENSSLMNFTYNSNGNLSTFKGGDQNADSSITFRYKNGTLASSTVTGEVTATTTYQFDNGKLKNSITGFQGYTVKNVYYYKGDNIIKIERFGGSGGESMVLVKTYTYEYDHKKNPLYDLGIQYVFSMDGEFPLFASKNNIIRKVATNGNGQNDPVESYEISYQYNTHNYPVKATKSTDGPTTISYYPCD